ncbi:MAG: hypothetical protein PHI99_06305, partial [Syntrophales bacterium]|nr:hypothetical protein [Syntrophales bacterium]
IYPYRYKEYFKAFEEFKFVQQMITDKQLKVERKGNLIFISNDYVLKNKVLDEYYNKNQILYQ